LEKPPTDNKILPNAQFPSLSLRGGGEIGQYRMDKKFFRWAKFRLLIPAFVISPYHNIFAAFSQEMSKGTIVVVVGG
jgi:hypothetical protein